MAVIVLLVGVVIGAVGVAAVVVVLMRERMIVPQRSARSFEDTCAAIEATVPGNRGFGFPIAPFDMLASLREKGVEPAGIRRAQLYFVCNAKLAGRVLSDQPRMAGIMPCSWAVYELDDGSVWLSKMNIGMMSRLFTGEVGTAMGEVAAADEAFMGEVLAPAPAAVASTAPAA
jgi:uncharacterized protein (DUF302 family)